MEPSWWTLILVGAGGTGGAEPWVEGSLGVAMGLVLAATCGLRAFLPLAVLSALAWTGHVELGNGFDWMGHPASLACFCTAVVAEVLGDKVPVFDHLLDSLGLVIRPMAGTFATASLIAEMDPLLATVVGLVTGGVAAGGVHVVKAKVRLLSTALTGGLGNTLLSVMEDAIALVVVVLAVLVPLLAVAALATVTGVALWWLRRRRQRAEATG